MTGEAFGQRVRRTNNFHSYREHVNEFGYVINLSYLKYESIFFPQLHLHYSRYLTSFFSLGAGYSVMYNDCLRNTFSLETSVRLNHFIFSFKPGVVMEKNDIGNSECLYSVGFEANYEFDLSESIHIGPAVGIDAVQDGTNYLIGFHMGFSF